MMRFVIAILLLVAIAKLGDVVDHLESIHVELHHLNWDSHK